MIPNVFGFLSPESVEGIVAALTRDPEGSVLLAGGSWVVPSMNSGEIVPRQVIDLRRAGLRGIVIRIEEDARTGAPVTDEAGNTDWGQVTIGACTTYTELLTSPLLVTEAPVLQLMAAGITGGPQITGRCTIGGSAAAARPASDIPATLLLLRAEAAVCGPAGERSVPVAQLWTDAFTTSLSPDEVITEFRFPAAPPGLGAGYVKIKHSTGSWPVVTAGAHVLLDESGRCAEATVAVGGAAPIPFLVPLTSLLTGRLLDKAAVDAAAEAAAVSTPACWQDELAPAEYRRAIVPVAVKRALRQAAAAAIAADPGSEEDG
jgi:carbon-monoxide dehydrogenase medium subunit